MCVALRQALALLVRSRSTPSLHRRGSTETVALVSGARRQITLNQRSRRILSDLARYREAPNRPKADAKMTEEEGLRERVTRQGEEAIGKLAQELLENPIVTKALSAAFETRERATRAQEVA